MAAAGAEREVEADGEAVPIQFELVRPATIRQREVAALLALDLSFYSVARLLDISVHTVRYHVVRLAARIPGGRGFDPRVKVVLWWRGAPRHVLAPPPTTTPPSL